MEPYRVIKYPMSTEKGIKLMETENKLLFVVDMAATKKDVKKAVEGLFQVKVSNVSTFINSGKKKAYVTIGKDTPAINVATKLGMI